ncbi:hypothetical protein JHK87_052842 [Glycine soja]|nr:hypothetical protein JHK87_052842 [Glycine soja]
MRSQFPKLKLKGKHFLLGGGIDKDQWVIGPKEPLANETSKSPREWIVYTWQMHFWVHQLIICNILICFQSGLAQQWYDELDDLAAPEPESEINVQDDNLDKKLVVEDEKVPFSVGVFTSPRTSEKYETQREMGRHDLKTDHDWKVIIYAALYSKLRSVPKSNEGNREEHAARILDILSSKRSGKIERDLWKAFLLKSKGDLRDLIFMKPLHIRLRLSCQDHPKADNGRDFISTDSSIKVDFHLKLQLYYSFDYSRTLEFSNYDTVLTEARLCILNRFTWRARDFSLLTLWCLRARAASTEVTTTRPSYIASSPTKSVPVKSRLVRAPVLLLLPSAVTTDKAEAIFRQLVLVGGLLLRHRLS